MSHLRSPRRILSTHLFPRRCFLSAVFAGSAGFFSANSRAGNRSAADESPDTASLPSLSVPPIIQASIEQGLTWLKKQTARGFYPASGVYGSNVGVVSLAVSAMMSSGSGPHSGPLAREISDGLTWLLSRQRSDGYIASGEGAESSGPMYGHALTTQLMADVVGRWQEESLQAAVTAAVEVIIRTQQTDASVSTAYGGWRYFLDSRDADASVTAACLMALRSAAEIGIEIPQRTVDRGRSYLLALKNQDGGFGYQVTGDRSSRFPRTAAAVAALEWSGERPKSGPSASDPEPADSPETARRWLRRFQPGAGGPVPRQYALYGYLHTALLFRPGRRFSRVDEAESADWYNAVAEMILSRQQPDGHWESANPDIGAVYATAVSLLILTSRLQLIPMFQR